MHTDPFRIIIDNVLIKRGLSTNYADDGSIHMGSERHGDNYIARWNTDILGPWPTIADGFTEAHLRKSPTRDGTS